MVKAAAAILLILLGVTAGALFLAAESGGAGGPAARLSPLASSPALPLAGAILFVLGVLVGGRTGAPDAPYPAREVVLILAVGAGAAFSSAAWLGVARPFGPGTVGALALGGAAQTALALALALWIAIAGEKRRALFVPGVLGAAALATFYLLVGVLGAA